MSAINLPLQGTRILRTRPAAPFTKTKKSEKPREKKYTRGCLAESPMENHNHNPTPMKKKLDVSLRPWDHASDAESRLL